jgi:signal transduction histidine kinase
MSHVAQPLLDPDEVLEPAGQQLAEEQAALRRVAILVARGVPQDELFGAVNAEIARLVGAEATAMLRFEPDDTVTLVAAWTRRGLDSPVGARRPVGAVLRALRDGRHPARFGPSELPLCGPFVEEARRCGIRSSVGVPITVDGRVWGVIFAAWDRREPAPGDTEARIAGFTELVAAAIANAQARSELQMLADEQAALRRVAELVARDVEPEAVFAAVAVEASRLLGYPTALLRYAPSGDATVVAVQGGIASVGICVPADGNGISARVLSTGRPARLDSYSAVSGSAPAIARSIGLGAAAGAPIVVEARTWGYIGAMTRCEPLPAGTEDRLARFARLVALAIGNAESRAELTASRVRVIATADAARRRIQRDLHDGAQQRLVQTVITLKLARAGLDDASGREVALVDEALWHAERATAELRELAHGILPAALIQGGLRAGVESLCGHPALPVDVDVTPERLPARVETTAYFVVAEALTNAVKHAGAATAHVRAGVVGGVLRLEVSDDGSGGADPARGTGLTGLADRVAACGGTFTVTSPPGEGTTLALRIPIERKAQP